MTASVSRRAVGGTNRYVRPAEFIVVLGPSGCGKSIILCVLGGVVKPAKGLADPATIWVVTLCRFTSVNFLYHRFHVGSWRQAAVFLRVKR
jgi:ABC-type sugar transport system ATPase subunit